jgi:RNA polymerase sigma-70 factor (ECF subfamily)
MAFVRAVTGGEQAPLFELLAEDAVLIPDAGPGGATYGKLRNVGHPVVGREAILTLVKAIASQDVPRAEIRERLLNGQPAVVLVREGHVGGAIMVSVADGKIRHVFMQFDRQRLKHVGPSN